MKTAVLIMFVAFTSLISGDDGWQLKKSGKYFKAYTKGNSDKFYKIEVDLDCNADSVYSFLTDFKKFPELFENISSLDILSYSDSVTIHYSVINTPWPFSDRDMVTRVATHKSDGKRLISSKSFTADSHKPFNNKVRIDDFEEQLEVVKSGKSKSRLKIQGRIKLNERIPAWLLDRLILAGPLNTVELIKNKYERREN
ncbi:MAG: START domain-containing protein [Candidatus Delongbacteria bacterium]